jgi:hypothetical protein
MLHVDELELSDACDAFAAKRANPSCEPGLSYLSSDDALPVCGEFKEEEIAAMVTKKAQKEEGAAESSSDDDEQDAPAAVTYPEAMFHFQELSRYLTDKLPPSDVGPPLAGIRKLLRRATCAASLQPTLPMFTALATEKRGKPVKDAESLRRRKQFRKLLRKAFDLGSDSDSHLSEGPADGDS